MTEGVQVKAEDVDRLRMPVPDATSFFLVRLGLHAASLLREAIEELGLRPRHYAVLDAIEGGGFASQQALGSRLSIDPTSLVALIDHLENAGLVERRRDLADRRRHVLTVTESGREVLRACRAATEEVEKPLLSALDPAEQVQLHQLLARLFIAAREGAAGPQPEVAKPAGSSPK
ncbi:MAG: MarR family winged helix-turn-helix transcriptional regulator [Actinobacteria bacterium]|nr:MarR family winged helix-turn-helix transcriptional regulator [Actinomycetota bacterium]